MCHTTIWNKDQQAHTIQRAKALEHSFSKQRKTLQWDEKTINHVAWSIFTLTCLRLGCIVLSLVTREMEYYL